MSTWPVRLWDWLTCREWPLVTQRKSRRRRAHRVPNRCGCGSQRVGRALAGAPSVHHLSGLPSGVVGVEISATGRDSQWREGTHHDDDLGRFSSCLPPGNSSPPEVETSAEHVQTS